MSTAVVTPKAIFASDNRPTATFQGHPIEWQQDDSAIVQGVEVFKAGTFRDSLGDQHTWMTEHLAQMVNNFDLLRNSGIFPNVPARRDHSFSVDKLMGYIEGLFVKGQKLLADIHVTEPTEVDKLARGTYRSVSLEVGMYVDNDEAMYWPVVFGVAYVDMPAVEGLHNKTTEISYFSRIQGEETMAGTNGTQVEDRPPQTVIHVHGSSQDATPPTPTPPTPSPAPAPAPAPTPTPSPAPAPAPTPNTPPTQPNPQAATGTFRIAGADVSDYGAVQRHIDALETTLKTVDDEARKTFVNKLSTDKKIVAAQVEGMQAFALTLDPTSYAAWCKTYEGAQPLSLLQNHGQGAGAYAGNPDAGATGEADPVADRIEVLTETVATFRRLGWDQKKIDTTDAGQELARLTASKS